MQEEIIEDKLKKQPRIRQFRICHCVLVIITTG
jgi:hypothetical protein